MTTTHGFRWLAFVSVLCALTSCHAEWLFDEETGDCDFGLTVELQPLYISDLQFESELSEGRVWVFDPADSCVASVDFDRATLLYNNARVHVDVPEGDYHLRVWMGLGDTLNYALHTNDESIALLCDSAGSNNRQFAPLWYGAESNIHVRKQRNTRVSLPMVKDTHTMVVLLQDESGQDLADQDYLCTLTTPHTGLDSTNTPTADGTTLRLGSYFANTLVTENDSVGPAITAAHYELNTLRLMADDDTRLRITRRTDGVTLLNIRLTDYLLMARQQHVGSLGLKLTKQQYLDYVDLYNIIFFLTPTGNVQQPYYCSTININGWVIRLNSVDL